MDTLIHGILRHDKEDINAEYKELIADAFKNYSHQDKKIQMGDFYQKFINIHNTKPLLGINSNEKVLIYFILAILNRYFFNELIQNENYKNFIYGYPLDTIFLASVTDIFTDHHTTIRNFGDHIKEKFLDILDFKMLLEIAYMSEFNSEDFFFTDTIIREFIDNKALQPIGINDMIGFTKCVKEDYFNVKNNDDFDEIFFHELFRKIGKYFFEVVISNNFSPFHSSAIFTSINELKSAINPKDMPDINQKLHDVLSSIRKKMNNVKMNDSKANYSKMNGKNQNLQTAESLPFYFLDLSSTSLHKLMEMNPRTKIPFTLSPYILKKDLPNIEVLTTNEPNFVDNLSNSFDSRIFACSPTSDSTVAVIRNIYAEFDPIPERLVDHSNNNIPKLVFEQKQTSTVPGMLVFKLSMLQWDYMPNFTLTQNFTTVFRIPYSSISKLGFKELRKSQKNNSTLYYIDIHTPDCNLCFYPLTENEKENIRNFLVSDIGIEEYSDLTYNNFFERTKNEMGQRSINTIRMMIEQQKFPIMEPNFYEIMFKNPSNGAKKEISDQNLEKIVAALCTPPRKNNKNDKKDEEVESKSTTLLLESFCYICQKEQSYAFKAIQFFKKEMNNADPDKKSHMLMILNRFFDPNILQLSQSLIDSARKWTESAQFLYDNELKGEPTPRDVARKVISGAEGAQFFALTSEDQEERFQLNTIHRRWLEKSVLIDEKETL
ncbi:hypothetical protein TRFO_07713 [Tritrichomonas foetus]|uniref:Uncharacterized protein n=1 Tax=Tritrichomonas foetus TaxID=1144522 RepID=A0A1J4JU41_9EUKA|nr:hypothetical protein TRFO_07713 [Tritrichomonas foetus]|eukprot:OHT01038.1 hypothetical protein TRFO_07713 [Tritrichomonas foetus]